MRTMPVLQKFCFCTKLETGGYVIGTSGLLFGIYFIVSSIQETVIIVDESESVHHKDDHSLSWSKFFNIHFWR